MRLEYITFKHEFMKQNYLMAGERLSPKKSTVQSILNFSKTLSVIKSGVLNKKVVLFKN